VVFTVAVVVAAGIVVHRFIAPVTWAGILAIATWPVFVRLDRALNGRRTVAALILTLVVLAAVAIPLIWLGGLLAKEIRAVFSYLATANAQGVAPPEWLGRVPGISEQLLQFWNDTLAEPGWVNRLLESDWLGRVGPAGGVVRVLGAAVIHRVVVLGFALLALFFFYRDGRTLAEHLNRLGDRLLGDRWELHASRIPGAIRATVNGIVLVGLAEGVLLGAAYFFAGAPSPVLLGAVTGVLAMIPFGAPIGFGAVAVYLMTLGSVGAAVAVLIVGAVVLFVADHFVRPAMIGGATRLPFLMVLFGILGGVETMGLVGLFVGPVVMVLLMTLWEEPV
jgi:predicted PurR-regulated permease PerM